MGSLKLQSFEDFNNAASKAAKLKLEEEQSAARNDAAEKFKSLLAEFGVTSVKDLNEEDKNSFYRKLGADEISESIAVIEEGTRSQIGVIKRNGKIESTYMHYDGYPDHMLPMIKRHYKNGKNVDKLLKGGGGRFLDSIDNMEFYGDMRSQTGNIKDIDTFIYDVANNSGAEFVYLWDESTKKWMMADTYDEPRELKPAFEHLIINEAFVPSKGNVKDAKKVKKSLEGIMLEAPDLTADSATHLGAIKYLTINALEDANFHSYMQPIGKKIGGKIRTIMTKIDGLGDIEVPVGAKTIQKFLEKHYSTLSSAAGWSGIGIVEGVAMYLDMWGFSKVAQAIVDEFNLIYSKEMGLSPGMNEGNAFLAARAKAIEEDAEEFEFNGKTYPVIKEAVTENLKADIKTYQRQRKLGYDDQFHGDESLAHTLSVDLGMDPKNEFSGGDFLGFDHVDLYVSGGKKEGTILDGALTGKYTYDELKSAAAEFLGIKESVNLLEPVNEAKFNISAEPEMFGDMIKGIIEKKPNRKYLVINGFDGEEIYATISDKPLRESVNEADLKRISKKQIQFHLDQFYGGNIDGNDLANAIEEIINEAKLSEDDSAEDPGEEPKSDVKKQFPDDFDKTEPAEEGEMNEDEIEIKVDGDYEIEVEKEDEEESEEEKEGGEDKEDEKTEENMNEAKFVKDFNKDVLDAETKADITTYYPSAKFFIGKISHFFGELEPNLFFKAYYAKYYKENTGNRIKGDFKIVSIYSQKGRNYEYLYNELSESTKPTNEAEVKSAEDFKEYAFSVLGKAFGDKFDEEKAQEVVDGLLDKHGDDYGAAVGALQSSLG